MAVPVPLDPSAGVVLTSTATHSWYQTQAYLLAPPKCRLTTSASNTTSATPLTWLSVAFNAETYDSTSMHDNVTNNSRITIAQPGYYRLSGKLRGGSSATALAARIAVGGVGLPETETFVPWATGAYAEPTINTTVYLTAGQYVELQMTATTASVALSAVGCFFEAHWVSN